MVVAVREQRELGKFELGIFFCERGKEREKMGKAFPSSLKKKVD